MIKLKKQPISHYTILDIDKINENISDIEKYQMKKVESIPITDRDSNMDHLCFVDLFPTGSGGMYDTRSISVKPAMYLRWILNQANPSARRNIQYLFSAIHNKEIRAIDSGIFAQVRATNLPEMTAKSLRNGLESNGKLLESNLFNTMSSVRGSKEYWVHIGGDLKAFDEHFGPATWFITLSSAEYNWQNLKEYLIKENNDLEDIEDKTLNELIQLDPLSVSKFWEKKLRVMIKEVILNENGPLGTKLFI